MNTALPSGPFPTVELLRTRGPDAYILALAASFPCLRSKIDQIRWSRFDEALWVQTAERWSTSERHAAAFALGVWNTRHEWRFDLFKAYNYWDDDNRAAAQHWLANPIWPRS
jgi:hypothetical protein